MSSEETGKVPSALARTTELSQAAVVAAEQIGDLCIERPYRNFQFTRAAQIVQGAIDREIAKAGDFIPADEYEMLSKAGQWREAFWHAYHRTHGHLPSGCSGCFKVQWALDEFTKPTRAACSEGAK